MARCEFCHGAILDEALLCRHCGMIRREHTAEMVAHHLKIAAVRQRLLQGPAQTVSREDDDPRP